MSVVSLSTQRALLKAHARREAERLAGFEHQSPTASAAPDPADLGCTAPPLPVPLNAAAGPAAVLRRATPRRWWWADGELIVTLLAFLCAGGVVVYGSLVLPRLYATLFAGGLLLALALILPQLVAEAMARAAGRGR